ncbi:MAG: redoxin domain-containing protein [Ginsengibacter sp.]
MNPKFFLRMLVIGMIPLICAWPVRVYAGDPKTLPIGAPAPDFNLQGVDGKMYTLSSFKQAAVLIVIFTCNHCPTAQSYEDRIIKLTADYTGRNVAVVAIMPNDPKALRLDELDFSDLGDSYDDMKTRAKDKHFNFPYLYDGKTEAASIAYGPVATPHVFIFGKNRKLRYCGRFDDMENHDKIPTSNDARNAVEALLTDKEVPVQTTKVFGCSVKWSDKRASVQKSMDKWALEPVKVDTITTAGIHELVKNNSGRLRLINIWSASCIVCTRQFKQFISINRMYRDRDFEFISLNVDEPRKKKVILSFLQNQHASNQNYIFRRDVNSKFNETIDPAWKGGLPYTILLEPGGKIFYSKQGSVDPAQLKKVIVENHLIGRYP